MKKVLIIAAVAAGAFFLMSGKKSNSNAGTDAPEDNDSVFTKYDNRIVKDKDGYWILVKDGKLWQASSDNAWFDWLNANPTKPLVEAAESIWLPYNAEFYGGTF